MDQIILAMVGTALTSGISVDTDGNISINFGPDASSSVDIGSYDTYSNLFDNYKGIATALLGCCIVTAIICFIFQITKLGAAGDNEQARRKAIVGIFVCGGVMAVFGSLILIVGVFWNFLGE